MAPSSCNRQSLHFIVLNDKDLIFKVGKTVKGGRFFTSAPILITVLNDIRPYILPEEKYILYQDAAAAIENILIMAQKINLGACWGGYTSDSNQISNENRVRRLLKIPKFFKITGIIALGKPGEQVCIIPRRNIVNITSFNYYMDNSTEFAED